MCPKKRLKLNPLMEFPALSFGSTFCENFNVKHEGNNAVCDFRNIVHNHYKCILLKSAISGVLKKGIFCHKMFSSLNRVQCFLI